MRTLDTYLRLPGMSVGYCHIEYGCKLAVTGLRGANGIARGNDGLYFVANDRFGEIFVLEMQDDHSLVLTDTIRSGACYMSHQRHVLIVYSKINRHAVG